MKEWDIIAESFDSTRKYPWNECLEFIDDNNGNGIDIGCGNGRHLIYMAERCEIAVGLDFSMKMIEVAKRKIEEMDNVVLVCGDACALPFRENFFDFAVFVASLHNIKGRENRIKALRELRRVLKKKGRAIISVWAKWQDKWKGYFLKNFFYFLYGREHGDIYIPWKKDGLNVKRFYHLYSVREFRKDIENAGLKIEKFWSVKKASIKNPDNHFAIVVKD
ncbi:MAG TPA: class I SAM-dependent methyltransferase [Thermoplasmatales archaeon]|nr:class I SAM-dependent methyltransferase [Thermoplasmatales archaeon]